MVYGSHVLAMIILAKDLAKTRTKKAAVIPYIVTNTPIGPLVRLLLAEDKQSRDWTYFGGGVKIHETTLEAAHREFSEESREIFLDTYPSCNFMTSAISIVDPNSDTGIIFLPVSENCGIETSKKFHDTKQNIKYVKKCYNEMSNVGWFSSEALTYLINLDTPHPIHIWDRCKDFYKNYYTSDFENILIAAYKFHYPIN